MPTCRWLIAGLERCRVEGPIAEAPMGVRVAESPVSEKMSGTAFRAFQARRPDHERWELIGGVPMMMTPPTIAHNRIASNLERLLNDALARHDPSRMTSQRPGVELQSGGDYKPEPDVGVIDADYEAGQRFVERAYLLAEIVSNTDDFLVPGTNEAWIEVKRRIYLAHEPCEAVLIIEQDRIEVRLDLKTAAGGQSEKLVRREDELVLASCGLRCAVGDLYAGTPLQPRTASRRAT
jgi:Uma2 family endonuclease